MHLSQVTIVVKLNDNFGLRVNSLGESDTVVVPVMNRIVKLHKDVSQDVHFFQAWAVNTKRRECVFTLASFRVRFLNISFDPVVRW